MDLLHPRHEADVDMAALYADPSRVRSDRPYVLANMVASTDGATALDGRSGGLSNEADRRLFGILRQQAQVVLVGAATARAENYRPSKVPGQRIAIVTRSFDLDFGSELFADGRGLVVTTLDAAEAPAGIPVVRAGRGTVDLGQALEELGVPTVLCEGGPGLLHQMISAGLLDELCLTLAPLVVGGGSSRPGGGTAAAAPQDVELVHVARDGDSLFLRYRRAAT